MGIQFKYEPPKINAAALLHERIEFAEHAGAELLLEQTKPDVPYREGGLVGSGIVVPTATGAAVVFSAVDEDDGFDYAAIQHENEKFHHERGKAHYLMDHMHQDGVAILAAAAAKLRF